MKIVAVAMSVAGVTAIAKVHANRVDAQCTPSKDMAPYDCYELGRKSASQSGASAPQSTEQSCDSGFYSECVPATAAPRSGNLGLCDLITGRISIEERRDLRGNCMNLETCEDNMDALKDLLVSNLVQLATEMGC